MAWVAGDGPLRASLERLAIDCVDRGHRREQQGRRGRGRLGQRGDGRGHTYAHLAGDAGLEAALHRVWGQPRFVTTAVVRPVGSVEDLFRLDPRPVPGVDRGRQLPGVAARRAALLRPGRPDLRVRLRHRGMRRTQHPGGVVVHPTRPWTALRPATGIGEATGRRGRSPFPTRPMDAGGGRGAASVSASGGLTDN